MAGGGDADRRGSAALLAADPRGSAGRGDAELKGSCWPPRRRARQGERRPERETPTGGEPAALEAEAPSAESPRGRWGLRLRLRAWDWVTGSRGLGDRGG